MCTQRRVSTSAGCQRTTQANTPVPPLPLDTVVPTLADLDRPSRPDDKLYCNPDAAVDNDSSLRPPGRFTTTWTRSFFSLSTSCRTYCFRVEKAAAPRLTMGIDTATRTRRIAPRATVEDTSSPCQQRRSASTEQDGAPSPSTHLAKAAGTDVTVDVRGFPLASNQ